MLMVVFVLSDLIWLPIIGGGRKSWYIITIDLIYYGEAVWILTNRSPALWWPVTYGWVGCRYMMRLE